jgi:hypothetical protein
MIENKNRRSIRVRLQESAGQVYRSPPAPVGAFMTCLSRQETGRKALAAGVRKAQR